MPGESALLLACKGVPSLAGGIEGAGVHHSFADLQAGHCVGVPPDGELHLGGVGIPGADRLIARRRVQGLADNLNCQHRPLVTCEHIDALPVFDVPGPDRGVPGSAVQDTLVVLDAADPISVTTIDEFRLSGLQVPGAGVLVEPAAVQHISDNLDARDPIGVAFEPRAGDSRCSIPCLHGEVARSCVEQLPVDNLKREDWGRVPSVNALDFPSITIPGHDCTVTGTAIQGGANNLATMDGFGVSVFQHIRGGLFFGIFLGLETNPLFLFLALCF
mmetsp:Transcript_14781/g.34645  ORF Transcript_14781/g.34645 Transcript_14781/m.34645 type:complete len:274 (+) Transcript_14781:3188-4009(+)